MFKQKHKPNPILNSSLPLFSIFCACAIIYLGFVVDYWFLLFTILLPLTFKKCRINWKQIVLLSAILIVFIFLVVFASKFSLFDFIKQGLNNIGAGYVKESLFNYYDQTFGQEIADFIKLILFNIKSPNTWIFYKQTVDLGVVWLICISGFHVSLLSKIIKKIFCKVPTVGKYVGITVIGFYSFLLDFSYASIRVLLNLCFAWVFNRYEISRYDKLGTIGLSICLLNPICFQSYGFLLSFSVCTLAYFISGFNLNNKIISSLLINVCAFLVTIPFVIQMNHKISLLTFLNAFIFSYLSAFVFLYFIAFSLIPFMAIIHYGIMVAAYVLVGNISFGNIYIYSSEWPVWIIFIYYFVYCGLAKVVYLIVYNNKI